MTRQILLHLNIISDEDEQDIEEYDC